MGLRCPLGTRAAAASLPASFEAAALLSNDAASLLNVPATSLGHQNSHLIPLLTDASVQRNTGLILVRMSQIHLPGREHPVVGLIPVQNKYFNICMAYRLFSVWLIVYASLIFCKHTVNISF